MNKQSANLGGMLLLVFVAIVGLYASNPTTKHFRKIMREQHRLTLDVASYLPISRVDYKLFSRFEVKYGFGKKTCYGAAAYVFVCPEAKTI